MDEGFKKAADGPALWKRAREQALDVRVPDLDEADLAAYLDGSLDVTETARVEAALAFSPETLDLLLATREAMEAAPAAAPEALVARAQGLVAEPQGSPRNWMSWFAAWISLPSLAPQRALAFASVAAGFLAVSVVGFELGRAEVGYSAEVDRLLAQEVAGLIDRSGEDLL